MSERARNLLVAWADWRGNVRQVMRLRRSPQCNLGRLVRIARQGGELWGHNEAHEAQYNEEIMGHVDRIICDMNWGKRSAILMEFVDGSFLEVRQKAHKLGLPKSTYHSRVKAAIGDVEQQFPWRLLRNPEDLYSA